jgi:hypothetical protein
MANFSVSSSAVKRTDAIDTIKVVKTRNLALVFILVLAIGYLLLAECRNCREEFSALG